LSYSLASHHEVSQYLTQQLLTPPYSHLEVKIEY